MQNDHVWCYLCGCVWVIVVVCCVVFCVLRDVRALKTSVVPSKRLHVSNMRTFLKASHLDLWQLVLSTARPLQERTESLQEGMRALQPLGPCTTGAGASLSNLRGKPSDSEECPRSVESLHSLMRSVADYETRWISVCISCDLKPKGRAAPARQIPNRKQNTSYRIQFAKSPPCYDCGRYLARADNTECRRTHTRSTSAPQQQQLPECKGIASAHRASHAFPSPSRPSCPRCVSMTTHARAQAPSFVKSDSVVSIPLRVKARRWATHSTGHTFHLMRKYYSRIVQPVGKMRQKCQPKEKRNPNMLGKDSSSLFTSWDSWASKLPTKVWPTSRRGCAPENKCATKTSREKKLFSLDVIRTSEAAQRTEVSRTITQSTSERR